jgi:hypothetical protein
MSSFHCGKFFYLFLDYVVLKAVIYRYYYTSQVILSKFKVKKYYSYLVNATLVESAIFSNFPPRMLSMYDAPARLHFVDNSIRLLSFY